MRRRHGTGRWLLPTVALFVLVPIALAVSTAVRGDGGDGDDADDGRGRAAAVRRHGSKLVAPSGAPALEIATPALGSYDITYRLTRAGGGATSSRERVRVRRPFDGRVTTTAPGASASTDRLSRLGALVLPTGSGVRRLEVPPALAASDLRFDIVLADAMEDGLIERREQRQVAGRRCQVYRFGSTVLSGEIVSVHERPGEHADVCVDTAGLLLEEHWVKDGRVLRQKVALAVETEPELDADTFTTVDEQPLAASEGNGLFRAVDPASAVEGTSWVVEPPVGFTFVGRFVVQEPRLDISQGGQALGAEAPTSIQQADVYTRGADALVVSTIVEADASAAAAPPAGAPVDAGPFGAARLTVDLRGNAVTTAPVAGRSLRVFGSMSPGELVAVLRSARAIEGTGLVFR